MPLHRRNSAGHCEENYLEEITEAAELEDELLHQITCSASKVCFWNYLYGSFCQALSISQSLNLSLSLTNMAICHSAL